MSESTTVLVQTETVGATVVVTGATVLGTVPVGPQGVPGDDGAAGPEGDSAYEVAVANGFVGTEAAWLASLVGPEGDSGAAGADGEGVPIGGTDGQVLTKVSATDFDTAWEDPAVTQAELDAEAALARNADNLTSGTVADARIAGTIARDSEVSAAISASEAGQVRDGDAAGGVLSGTYPNPGFAADMATQAELDAHVTDGTAAHAASAVAFTPAGTIAATDVQAAIEEVAAEAGGSGGQVDSVVAGTNIDVDATDPANPVVSLETLEDADIPASIARDSEVTAAISASEAGQVRDGDAAGGGLTGTYPNPTLAFPIDHTGATAATDAVSLDVTGDSANRFVLNHDGSMEWGSGTAAADAILSRSTANLLRLLTAGFRVERASALDNALSTIVTGNALSRWRVGAGGIMEWGDGGVIDVSLRRGGANQLETEDEFKAVDVLVTGKTGATATPVTLAGGTASGAPASGAHVKGEIVFDDAGAGWFCTVAGTPGTWVRINADAGYALDSAVVHDTGDETIAGVKTFSSDPIIPDEAYDATAWNGSLEPPTKNAVRDKLETMGGVSSVDGQTGAVDLSTTYVPLAGTWRIVDQDFVTVTSGDITLNQTAITALTAFDLTCNAQAGDVLIVEPLMKVNAAAQTVAFDAYTMVGGSRVNPVGAGLSASLGSTLGVTAWLMPNEAVGPGVTGAARYTLVSGDISAGTVTVSLHYAKSNTTARTLFASTNTPAQFAITILRTG